MSIELPLPLFENFRGRIADGVRNIPGPAVLLVTSVVVLLADLPQVDPDKMTDLGLVSVLPGNWFLALGLLLVSFGWTLWDTACSAALRTAHVIGFVVIIHGTPPLLYGTMRFSWAWKHLGVIDFILRHGGLSPNEPALGVYHNWPGFFSLFAAGTKLSGATSALAFASWAPVFFNLLMLAALVALYRSFTNDSRLVAVASMLFFLGSWISQDYFSPQGLAFVLYVMMLVVWRRLLDPSLLVPAIQRRAGYLVFVLLSLAIASSHQLTPILMIVTFTVLAGIRRGRGWQIPLICLVTTVGWWATGARPYVAKNLRIVLASIGSDTNTSVPLDLAVASPGRLLVARLAMGLSGAFVLLAMVGIVRLRHHRSDLVFPLAIAASPIALVAMSAYGGEVLLRAYMFTLPGAAFLAAVAIAPAWGQHRWSLRDGARVSLTTLLLFTAMVFAYYGNDRMMRFTKEEVTGAKWLYDNAPLGSLIIGVNSNLPWALKNYEAYSHRWVGDGYTAPPNTLNDNPMRVIDGTIEAVGAPQTFVILNRAQEAWGESSGIIPPGTFEYVKSLLLASPEFRTVYSRPGVIILRTVEK